MLNIKINVFFHTNHVYYNCIRHYPTSRCQMCVFLFCFMVQLSLSSSYRLSVFFSSVFLIYTLANFKLKHTPMFEAFLSMNSFNTVYDPKSGEPPINQRFFRFKWLRHWRSAEWFWSRLKTVQKSLIIRRRLRSERTPYCNYFKHFDRPYHLRYTKLSMY